MTLRATSQHLHRLFLRVAASACLLTFLSSGVQAQKSKLQTTDYVGFGLSYLRTDFDALTAPLARAGYPTFTSNGIRFDMRVESRIGGRWQTGLNLSIDNYFNSGANSAVIGAQTRTSSMSFGGLGARVGIGYDLLYPSAWNLMLGLDLESFLGQLKTSQQLYGGPNGPFDGRTNDNRYRIGAISAIPQLTLESVEFGDSRSRIYLGVGYRLSADTQVLRNDDVELAGVGDISHGGVVLSLGIKSVMRGRG